VIRFEGWTVKARVLNPLKGFELEVQELERRVDPLTGHTTIVARGRLPYVKQFMEHDEQLLRRLADASRASCPFCPERVEQVTPKFPSDVVPEGRVKVGRCIAFPSLHAHSDFNAVVVLGPRHLARPSELDEDLIYEGLKAGVDVALRAYRSDHKLRSPSIVMNYLPPAGSSIVHPHMQVLSSTSPFNVVRELLARSFEFYTLWSRCYWDALVEEERRLGERYIGSTGPIHWLAPYAPSRHFEVWGVGPSSDLSSLGDGELRGIARGVANVLRFYESEGLLSFNFAVYSAPLGGRYDYFKVLVKVCSRFGLKEPFLNDFWAMPALLGEGEVMEAPEDYASRLRSAWRP